MPYLFPMSRVTEDVVADALNVEDLILPQTTFSNPNAFPERLKIVRSELNGL